MPRDAKLGLVLGVVLVLSIAVTYFRKDSLSAQTEPLTPTAAKTAHPNPPQPIPSVTPPIQAPERPETPRPEPTPPEPPAVEPSPPLPDLAPQN